MQTPNRRAMAVLFLTLFIVMVGFGVILPILPFYAESMGATATHLGLLFGLYAVVQFIFAPMWGQLSDRVGRKPLLVMGLLGFSISFLFFGLATSLWMLFAARILGGVLSAATLPTTMAYIADSTDTKTRGGGMGMMGASMGLGMTFGPVVGGFLGGYNTALPFFFSAALGLAVAVFVYFLLPESLSEAIQQKARGRHTEHNGLVQGLIDVWLAASKSAGFILILAFLASFASSNLMAIFALFSQAHLGFGEAEVGLIFGVMGLVMAFTQGVLVGPFIKHWGEGWLINLGLLGSGIGYLLLVTSTNLTNLVLIMIVMGLANAALRPATSSLVSKRTRASEQGNMMGVLGSYTSLGRVFGPIVGGLIFDAVGYQWPFIVGGIIFFMSLAYSVIFFHRDRRHAASARSLGASDI